MKLSEMVESFMKNDNKAFEYIFHRCGEYTVNKLIQNRNCTLEEAEDLLMDAILIFRNKMMNDEISFLTNLRSYIYRICDNNYLASLKRDVSRSKLTEEITEVLYAENAAIDPLFSKAAMDAWNRLSEKCKDIIYLFYVESIRMEEIAKLLGLSNADTAKSTKARCYKKFVSLAKEHF